MYLRRSRSYLFTRTTLLNTAPFEPVQPSDVARFFLLRRLLSVHNADYLVASEHLAISPCSAFISSDLIVHIHHSDACILPYGMHRLPPLQELRCTMCSTLFPLRPTPNTYILLNSDQSHTHIQLLYAVIRVYFDRALEMADISLP